MQKLNAFYIILFLLFPITLFSQHSLFFTANPTAPQQSDRVTIEAGTALTGNFTIEAWLNYSEFTAGNPTIFGSKGVDDNPWFGIIGANDNLIIYDKPDPVASVQDDASFPQNKWTHVAAAYDGSIMNLYIDGDLAISATSSGFNSTVGEFFIGFSGGNNHGWNGYIDNVLLWNYARTEAQIESDMLGNVTGAESGLLLFFELNEGSGQTVSNTVPSGADGYLGSSASDDPYDPAWSTEVPPAGPAGAGNATLWYRANLGVNTGSTFTLFNHGIAPGANAEQSTASNQPAYTASGESQINFNPVVSFDGADDNLESPALTTNLLGTSSGSNVGTQFVVWRKLSSSHSVYNNSSGQGAWRLGLSNDGRIVQQGVVSNTTNNVADNEVALLDMSASTSASSSTFSYRKNGGAEVVSTSGGFTDVPFTNPVIIGKEGSIFTGMDFAELIIYPSVLSDANRLQVQSYLAIKYGISLDPLVTNYLNSAGTVIWNNASYWNDVFGIGRDDLSGLTQTSSNSINSGSGDGTGQAGKGNIVLSNPSSLEDGDYLMIGHDNANLSLQQTDLPVELEGANRVKREWKVQETNDVVTVDLSVDLAGLNLTSLTSLTLLIDEDGNGDFTDGTVTPVQSAAFDNTGKVEYTGVDLSNGVVITFALAADVEWTGDTDKDWATATNWNGGFVPGASDNVTIPDVTNNNDPVINPGTIARCADLNVQNGATLTVNGELKMTGD